MRAGPLSDSKVIDLLNRYFIPVTAPNDDPDPSGERGRIKTEFGDKHLGVGDVHVYVIGPDRAAIAGLDIGTAMDTAKEVAFLNDIIARLHRAPGPPIFPPHPQSSPPKVESGAPAIHLVARKASELRTWNEFPSENWILLTRQEWEQILPPFGAQVRSTWQIPAPVATKLAQWIYPQTEEVHTTNRNRVDLADFRLTLTTVEGSLARARIEGRTRLQHSFYPGKPTDDLATSELTGFADLDLASRQVQRLRIVTRKGDYQNTPFLCSLVSVSRETLDAQQ